MTIESESAYNKYLGFYFGKGFGKQIGYVYINIGGTQQDKNDTNKIEIDRVGIMPWHIGEGWCKPLVIYALKRSIKELSNKFWTKNEELKGEPIIGNIKIVSENSVAANRCYTHAFEAIGFKKTEESEAIAKRSLIDARRKMVTQSLKFESGERL